MNEQASNPGQIFRETREKLGLSINDVTIATKINPRILRALEAGEKEKLPAPSFTRGFIKTYAAYLKIESQPILDGFQFQSHVTPLPGPQSEIGPSETNISEASTEKAQSKSDKKNDRQVSITNDPTLMSKIYISAALVVLVLLIFAVKRLVDKYSQERIVDVPAVAKVEASAPPTGEVSESTEVETPTDEAPPITPEESKTAEANLAKSDAVPVPAAKPVEKLAEKAPEKPAEKPADKNVEKPSDKVIEKPVETVSAKSPEKNADRIPEAAAAKPAEKPAAKVEKPADANPATKPATAPSSPQEVLIEAMDKVDITVSVDGGDPKKMTLKPEGMHMIRAKKSVQLSIQDGGMVNIIHNGRDKGVPGDLGKPIQLKYP